jgi:cellulose synthase/poly-beta-1,6-N-acetylglucosamine synthase-like glycosyltransferase
MSTIEIIIAVGFWCSIAGVAYAYLGYPAVIYVLSRTFGRAPVPPVNAEDELPRVALLIAAHNEATVIEQRIRNILALEYPTARLQIVIASDGSDDGTVEICRGFEPRVRVLAFPERRGKAATLNASLPHLDGEIAVLSDANTSMDTGALRALVRWFVDPGIGAVCGRLILSDSPGGRNADGTYWRYETFLKRCEDRLGGPLGANGAIYAIRRSLLVPLAPNTIIDDFVIPLAAKIKGHCRIIYDAQAIAHEETPHDLRSEFRRRTRIGIGGFQALGVLWPLLFPSHGWTAFAFWSHKVLRWICPFLMVAALLGALALAGYPVYRIALIGQCVFYALSSLVALVPSLGWVFRPLRIFPMFAGMNLALMMGCFGWLRGRQTGVWSRTPRSPHCAVHTMQ